MFKEKLVLLAPIIAFLVVFVFSLTLFPTVQSKPRNLPIAVVNEDQGFEIQGQPKMTMGQTIVEMMRKTAATNEGAPAVKWVDVSSVEEARNGLNNQEYYAALVIPSDFSAKQASLRAPKPSLPEVQLFINQGMNAAAAAAAGQILNGVVENMNNSIRAQLLESFKMQGVTLTVEQAASLASPIAKKVTNVNETGAKSANGNAPVSLFQPLWLACIACSAILFITVSKLPVMTRRGSLVLKLLHILMGAVAALAVGFGLTWLANGMLDLDIPKFADTALFLTVTFFSFFLMITAVLYVLGIRGVAIFALLLFFGAPLLALAPEMMSTFYRDWIHPWLPMRFMVDGLRQLFFFGKGFGWNAPVAALTWISMASSIVILGSAFKVREQKFERTV
ncbi:YhgE/Pip domain-containing protein [Paenibacillus sp. J31TS4]|uniref:YhgE/Pip domain-containing protein n=1 Tax=Paenibacillus sp. J31TS4 TaxID=2807195 RepID=UPI001BD01259|nr:ABC transporter permease [Paenibacillus sp. J31TS4]